MSKPARAIKYLYLSNAIIPQRVRLIRKRTVAVHAELKAEKRE